MFVQHQKFHADIYGVVYEPIFFAFLHQPEERSRKYLSAGPRALVITVILRRFSNSNFSRSKLNIKNLSDRSLEVLVFSQKIEKYL